MFARARARRQTAALFAFIIFVSASMSFGPLAALAEAQGPPPNLPPQAAEVVFDGELEVEIEDHPDGSRVNQFVRVNRGNGFGRIRLESAGGPLGLVSGTRVRARGRLRDANTLELAPDGGSVQVMALANPNTFGEQRVAVILVNFQDNTSVPYQWTAAHNVTFNDTNAFFQENSFGQTWLTGQVFGWYTLPMTTGTCDYSRISSLADQAATAAGVNLSQFSRKVYAFPQIGACSWWGLGSVGGNPSRAWINGSYQLKVVAHELGHNFGDYHSNAQPCAAGSCSITEYGDDRDMMGGSAVGHFTAFQKERLGWLNYGSSPLIQHVTTSGVYHVEGYGLPWGGSAPKALRILKSTDANGRRTWYYVESRVRLGFDGYVAAGVTIHTGSEATGNSSYQLDIDQASSGFDSTLDPGQIFTDASIDLAIRTVSADGGGAYIEVSYPGVPCTTAAPTVSMSPSSASVEAGKPVSFTVSVQNNDSSSGCASTQFGLNASAPSGWSPVLNQTALTIAPGATLSATFTATPPAGTTGAFSVSATAARVGTSGPGGSTSATVNVTAPATTAPPVSSLSVAFSTSFASGFRVLTATVHAGANPAGGATVSFAVRNPQGKTTTYSATTNASGVATTKFKMKPRDPKGTYAVTATASRDGVTGTASGSFAY
jgi:hypothetical protein